MAVFLGSDRGRSPVEWEDFLSIHPSVPPHLRVQEPARQALDPASQASEPARQVSEPASQASEPASQPDVRTIQLGLRANQPDNSQGGRKDGGTENLPILQDFLPF